MREQSRASEGIFVTGATGNVGSQVCKVLSASDRPVFGACVDDETDAHDAPTEEVRQRLYGAAPRVFDFTDTSTWEPALEGVSKVFLMRPPHISRIRRDLYPFMEHMKMREIEHVVFLSVQGAEANTVVPHHKVEQAILALGLPYTFVRPSFFMQNLTTTHIAEIRDEHRIFVPAGTGVTNFIDVRDVAEAIAATLLDDRHENTAYTVTGEESYTYHEVAERMTRILGIEITYEPARAIPFIRYQLRVGRSLGHALVMYALYSVTRLGKAGVATETFERLVGRKPRSLDEFIADHHEVLAGVRPR